MSPATAVLPSLDSPRESPPSQPLPGRFSSAFEFLLACCRASVAGAPPTQTLLAEAAPSTAEDWARLIALAEHHRLLPQLHAAFERCGVSPPEAITRKLQALIFDQARSALWFTSEMLRILAHLEDRGIPALPYKGPVLAHTLYGDVTLRQFGDLDFLVHPTDVFRARAALRELSYEPGKRRTARQERSHLASHYELAFGSPRKSNLIELQWRILPRFYAIDFDLAGFFEHAETLNLGGVSFRSLCAEDLLLTLCVHAAKHAWNQLSLVADIAALAVHPQLNWENAIAQAKSLRIERIVFANLWLAHELLGTEIPTHLGQELSPALRGILLGRIRDLAAGQSPICDSPQYFRWMLALREDWRDRARFLWRLAFTPSAGEWAAVALPEFLFPLYGVVRLARLAKRLSTRRSGPEANSPAPDIHPAN